MLETHGEFKEDPRNKFVFDEMVKFSSNLGDNSIIIDIGAGQSELSTNDTFPASITVLSPITMCNRP